MTREDELKAIETAIAAGKLHRVTREECERARELSISKSTARARFLQRPNYRPKPSVEQTQ